MRFIQLTKTLRNTHWLKTVHKRINLWVFQFISDFARKRSLQFRCMNYGFVGGDQIRLDEKDEEERYPFQMYHKLVSHTDIAQKKVLEVGCGRGGGAFYLTKYLQAGEVTGLDISQNSIGYCQENYHLPNLNFVVGDAENLSFPPDTFDVVVNLESSHGYPYMEKFLDGVQKVLKPDGVFCWADLRYKDDIPTTDQQFQDAEFEVMHQERLTPGVIQSLIEDSQRKEELLARHVRWSWLRWFLGNIWVVKGSSNYQSYEKGEIEYLLRVMRKGEG